MNGAVIQIVDRDEKTLAIPGAMFTPTALNFDQPPTEETLRDVAHLLQRMASSLRYWQGDHLRAWTEFVLQGEDPEPEKQRQLELIKISEYAEISGQSRDALAEADAVARFFPTAARRPGLKFEHHVEAYNGCAGDFLMANAWLDLAEAGGWDVAKLRAHIRGQRAKQEPQEPKPDDIDDAAEMELWAARQIQASRKLTTSAAETRLRSLRKTAELIDLLRARAAPAPR
jgi:hypothetical protein